MKWLFCLLFLVVAGCTTTPDPLSPQEITPTTRGIYVLNEGLWGQSNASLTLYDPQAQTVQHDVFTAANGRPLGDVGNHILVAALEAYIVVNGSDRIEVIDLRTQKSRGTVTLAPGLSPRQMAVANDSLGLVTNLYNASVSVINLRTLTETSRIPVGQNPEGIAIAAGTAFVANSGLGTGRSVSMIDIATLSPIGDLAVADNPADILAIDGSQVLVLCAGSYGDFADPTDDSPAALITINALQRQVVDTLVLGGHAFRMAGDGQSRIYIAGSSSVLTIDLHMPGTVETFVVGGFNGVGVDSVTGDVYLADARTFTVPGEIKVFGSAGNLKGQFEAGLIPGRFAFFRQ